MLAQSIGAKSGSPLAQHVGTMLRQRCIIFMHWLGIHTMLV